MIDRQFITVTHTNRGHYFLISSSIQPRLTTRFFVFLRENDWEIIGMLMDAETLSCQILKIKQEKPRDVSRIVVLTEGLFALVWDNTDR